VVKRKRKGKRKEERGKRKEERGKKAIQKGLREKNRLLSAGFLGAKMKMGQSGMIVFGDFNLLLH